MKLVVCLLLALAVGQAAAWNCPGGVKGADQVTGYSPFFGIKGEDKPMKYVDQTTAWKKYGAITKVNLFYSWTYNCLQGVKVTYGYDSANAQLLGNEKGLTGKHIILAPYEHINKVEVKAQPNKCIEWIKLHTNKTAAVSVGNEASAAPLTTATVNRKAGFLAAIRGYEDYYPGKAVTKGGLQQLQFVWGVAVCPEAPPPPPAAPVVEPPAAEPPAAEPPAESPAPIEGPQEPEAPAPAPEPAPEPTPEPAPLCPAVKAQCDAAATEGAAYCPAVAPNAAAACTGGCCVSAGKCKKPLCGMNGLGAEVMAKDMFCWGSNGGPLNKKFNKCRNLACKLSVPGCMGDLLSGACVGTVAALSEDVDAGAKQWVGYPCLQPVPGGLPVDALGKWDINGAYAGRLWTICNCKASAKVPGYSKDTCKGPLCELFKKPELPSLNFALPHFSLPDVSKLIDAKKEVVGDIAEMFKAPNITIPSINLKAHVDELKAFLNGTASTLSAPLREALKSKFPTFSLNLTKPEVPTLSLNIPRPDLNLADLLPQLDMSKLGSEAKLRVFNMSQLTNLAGGDGLHTLDGLLKAFNLHGDDDSAAAAPAPAAASAAAAAAGPAISVEGVEEVAADAAPAEAAAQEAGVAPEEQVGIELLQVGEDAQDAEIEGEFTDDAELEMPESV